MMYCTQNTPIALPITGDAHQIAQQFAQEQLVPDKAAQIYQNTLAVLIVRDYLVMLDVPTDLKASFSWNPAGRIAADLADLYVMGSGRLECRPIRVGDLTCFIPPQAWDDLIGYVVVQLDEANKEGKILGFTPQVSTTQFPISELQPLELLIDCLSEEPDAKQPLEQLGRWLENQFGTKWKALTELPKTPGVVFAGTSSEEATKRIEQLYANHLGASPLQNYPPTLDPIPALIHLLETTQDEETRWKAAELLWEIDPGNPATGVHKAIDLGIQLAGSSVALMVAILPKSAASMSILLRAYPMGDRRYLPPGLRLLGLKETGEQFFEVATRKLDDYIQYKFTADSGDQFSVRVVLGNDSVTEGFVV
ncbi:MAG: DUF1822 family protein [Leptolyngbyaceae cyanobacterium bins.302]|nr:DUF1822 family protein [Leptolyngbyaceae cyanobacterium bins.302]